MCSVKSLGCGLMQVFRLKRICFQGLGQEGKVWKGRERERERGVCVRGSLDVTLTTNPSAFLGFGVKPLCWGFGGRVFAVRM